MSKDYYRPLPEYLTIKNNKELEAVTGKRELGLYATQTIQEWQDLGISHVANSEFKDGWIRTPLGGFVNHSENPNCEFIKTENEEVMVLYTTQCIEPGEELTANYTLYNPTK